tara:strand:+ start:8338 stop:8625 length:288 start_codon:yes stop_codon:yes gene_type:complete
MANELWSVGRLSIELEKTTAEIDRLRENLAVIGELFQDALVFTKAEAVEEVARIVAVACPEHHQTLLDTAAVLRSGLRKTPDPVAIIETALNNSG